MKRRTVLTGFGSLAFGSILTIGTGAFSTVNSDRSIRVSVEDDHQAYLALDEVGTGGRSTIDGGELKFSIPGVFEDDTAKGIGTDSVYQFGSDANGTSGNGLFTVQNKGTQAIEVFSTQETTNGTPSVTIYNTETGQPLTEDSPYSSLGTGEQIRCGLQINTQGVPIQEIDYTVQLIIYGNKINK